MCLAKVCIVYFVCCILYCRNRSCLFGLAKVCILYFVFFVLLFISRPPSRRLYHRTVDCICTWGRVCTDLHSAFCILLCAFFWLGRSYRPLLVCILHSAFCILALRDFEGWGWPFFVFWLDVVFCILYLYFVFWRKQPLPSRDVAIGRSYRSLLVCILHSAACILALRDFVGWGLPFFVFWLVVVFCILYLYSTEHTVHAFYLQYRAFLFTCSTVQACQLLKTVQ